MVRTESKVTEGVSCPTSKRTFKRIDGFQSLTVSSLVNREQRTNSKVINLSIISNLTPHSCLNLFKNSDQ